MHFPQVDFLSSQIRQDHVSPKAPQTAGGTIPRLRADIGGAEGARKPSANEFPEIPPQEGAAITISVIEGFSKGLAYQMSRSCITAGRIGGGADFEFDDLEASDVHYIVAARQDGVRVYDGASTTGIYVNDRRISTGICLLFVLARRCFRSAYFHFANAWTSAESRDQGRESQAGSRMFWKGGNEAGTWQRPGTAFRGLH